MAKVAISDAGIATAAMIVERHEPHEDQDHQGRQQAAHEQVFLDFVHGGQDVPGLVLDDLDMDVRRQDLLAPLQPLLDGLDHVHGVFARLALYGQHDGRPTVKPRQVADLFGGVDGLAQVAQPDGHAAGSRDDHVQEVAWLAKTAQGAQAEFAGARVDATAGDVCILTEQSVADLEDRQLVCRQPLGLDVDLHGAILGPGDGHLADPGRRFDEILDGTVRQHKQLARLAIAGERQRQDRGRFQVLFPDDGRIDVFR